MLLKDLDPHWVSDQGRHGMAVTFKCPCCLDKPPDQQIILGVSFCNPIDGGPPFETPLQQLGHWLRTYGDSFENLTVAPSIDASALGHWHGHVINGKVE